MPDLVPLERPEVEKVRVYRIEWNRAPASRAHHTTEVIAHSDQEAIDILREHVGFEIDCWFGGES